MQTSSVKKLPAQSRGVATTAQPDSGEITIGGPSPAIARPLVKVVNVVKTYHVGEVDVPVLKGVSAEIHQGEFVALMGASGSGKTTLMNILGCLDRPTSGEYWLDGVELSRINSDERAAVRNGKIGFVFQNFNLLARTTALDNVQMPLEYGSEKLPEHEREERARGLLERVGLADRMEHEPSQMSGGQQQRVAIARSLINNPMVLLADEPTGNLDSKTSKEIMQMFHRLNAEGITIILVTHDPEVAANAHRVIHVKDGLISGDERSDQWKTRAAAAEAQPAPKKSTARPTVRHRIFAMVPRTLRSAANSILRNKMRSGLTALGIIIGVSSVIAMMEIGKGSASAIQKTIASMGANNLMVFPGAAASGGNSWGVGSKLTLTPNDAEAIKRQSTSVAHVAPVVRVRSAPVVYGNRNWVPQTTYGSTPDFLEIRDWTEMSEGEMFTDRQVTNGSQVCVIGQTVARELFQSESPIGKEIRMQNVSFKVLGVLTRKGANMWGMDQDDVVLAPWTTIKYRVSSTTMSGQNQTQATQVDPTTKVNTLSTLYPGSLQLYPVPSAAQQANTPQPVRHTNVDQIHVEVASAEDIKPAIEQITDILRETHHLRPGEPDDFNVRDMTEIGSSQASTSEQMSGLLVSVALISLIVGGVGIMNIMLVSVTERTREIGLRMAVGAKEKNILTQFLIEAMVLCLLGGAMGIVAGRVGSMLVTMIKGWPTEPSLLTVIAAVFVSATVGILFGFYPAWKASRLDPITALRYE